jgi:hypothetical protein
MALPSRHVHHLDGLQHVRERDHQVPRPEHAPGLEQGESAVQVAIHVLREAKAEGDDTPLEVQTSPYRR